MLLLVVAFLPATQAWAQTYPVLDTFSGSAALSSNWTDTTANGYVATAQMGGSAVPSVSGEQSLATYTGAAFTADQYAQVKFVTHSSDASSTGPCVRMTISGNGVCYLADDGVLYVLSAGSGDHAVSFSCPIPSSGDTIRLFVIGTVYTCMDVTTGASASGSDGTYTSGSPAILVDERNSTVYALAQFQADCLPSCSGPSGSTISLGSFSNTVLNPGFDNSATSYQPSGSTVGNVSNATFNLSAGTDWHSPIGLSSWISFDGRTGPDGDYAPPNGDYFYTTTFTTRSNQSMGSAVGTLTILADDTVAVYLNGVLIQNSGGPMGPDNGYTHCSDTGPNCVTPLTFTFTGIANGVNVLTFDVKQVGGYSEGLDYVGSINLNAPVAITPSNVQLYAGQTQQFQANTGVSWSVVGAGTISSTGLYTAPATIANQQTVTITATSQADTTETASATITLEPPVAVSVTPTTALLQAGQTQQFASSVTNSSNTGVSWSINSGGTGTISAAGLYTAPASITTQQTVTVTATSQADTTKSASATIYLLPPCMSNGYSYGRSIVIDHTKVPNTDQTNFPFLFSTVDQAFRTTSNGGHVTNSNGYDIIFTSDSAGMNRLPFEQESYSSSTGAVIYWINVPLLSHTSNTAIYMWYGNLNITTSQANAPGVWSTGYEGVYHLFPNGTALSATDSTANGDTGSITGVTATTGKIDGGASFGESWVYRPAQPSGLCGDRLYYFHLGLECPAFYVPVLMRETGQKGADDGEGQEAYSRTDCELAAAD